MKLKLIISALCAFLMFSSCEKEAEIPPTIKFKTDAGYLSADATVAKSSTLLTGIVIDKVEDELKTLNVSVAYDGATNTETREKVDISGDPGQFSKDFNLAVRNQAGSEKWYFTVTDSDGNTAQVSVKLTVE